jgi:membrane-bound lytic murein transglycosylase B
VIKREYMRKIFLLLFIFVFSLSAKDYTQKRDVQHFINMMVKKHQFKRGYLVDLFENVRIRYTPFAKRKKSPPRKGRPYGKYGGWDRYVEYILTPKRVEQGVSFLKRHEHIFHTVEKRYGVPKEYIAAIIGVESAFGNNVGKFRVFDTLTVRAFSKKRRSGFYKRELEKFLLLGYRQGFNVKNVNGSHAGAIGLGQFMPSNYEIFGVDFNGDGKIRMQQPKDAIASIANYIYRHGWQKNGKVATRVSYEGNRFRAHKTGYKHKYNRRDLKGIAPKYGHWNYNGKVRLIKLNRYTHDELWYGAKNFYVLTRYNHSSYYAMSVHQLATKLKVAYQR